MKLPTVLYTTDTSFAVSPLPGAEGSYPVREVCGGLHLVCGHHPQPDQDSW